MKTKILLSTLMSFLFLNSFAQDRTTVNASSSEISDNLDLRAVASIFGDSRDLEDFEKRLNDPKNQISNLDLNGDNEVDYLRVIETVEGRTHLIVLQSVLGRDTFQDVATVEVEKDSNNRVQVQVVGDVYMYGQNYIYEPVYVSTPIIYDYFWTPAYRPYYSSWYWGYYPSYYYAWNPFPVFRYRNNIGIFINFNHHYNYVNYRRCQVAYNNYYSRRGNYYERQHPNRSFERRNSGYTNRYELDRTRNIRTVGSTRNDVANVTPRTTNGNPRSNNVNPRSTSTPRNNGVTPRNTNSPRNTEVTPRTSSPRNTEVTPRTSSPRNNEVTPRTSSPRNNDVAPRQNNPSRNSGNIAQRSPSRNESSAPRGGNSSENRGGNSGNRGDNSSRR
ncbi:hypothetical protein [Flavobacterium sp.]|uniref:hypothetical protein n=1 Tax=Flavobacterium sp. TaxID=239 RepID=UPI000EEFE3A2|nr:hypothetical protein [Flavobacterium sp.]HCQ12957.1 hypothetical protein [Flavobacterium sp.]